MLDKHFCQILKTHGAPVLMRIVVGFFAIWLVAELWRVAQ